MVTKEGCRPVWRRYRDLKSGSKVSTVAKARAVLCYLGVRKLGLTSVSISKELGISQSAVSKAIDVRRAEKDYSPTISNFWKVNN